MQLDWCVGELTKTLERLGLSERTLVVFCSDNGPEGTGKPKPKHDAYRGSNYGTTAGLRGRKRFLYNGGVCMPAAVVWPDTIEAGRVVRTPVSTLDYLYH